MSQAEFKLMLTARTLQFNVHMPIARPTGISLFYLTLPLLSKGSSHAGVRAEAETTGMIVPHLSPGETDRSAYLPAAD